LRPETIAAGRNFDLLSAIGFSKREIEAANIHVCGAMTVEGAPHLKAEHYAVFRLRQPVRPHRQALPVGGKHNPHDGGGAAVHLGAPISKDHQHAERSDGRGLQGGLSPVLAARAQANALYARRLETVAAADSQLIASTR